MDELRKGRKNTGQVFDVYLTEGQAEDIYPGGYATITAGGGGNPSGGEATTFQTTSVGYTPTKASDGASIASAKGLRLYLNPGGTQTWVDGGLIYCWRYAGGAVWVGA